MRVPFALLLLAALLLAARGAFDQTDAFGSYDVTDASADHYARGADHYDRGDDDAAIASFAAASRFSPSAEAFNNLGQVLLGAAEEGAPGVAGVRLQEARAALERAVALDAENSDAAGGLAEVLRLGAQPTTAGPPLRRATEGCADDDAALTKRTNGDFATCAKAAAYGACKQAPVPGGAADETWTARRECPLACGVCGGEAAVRAGSPHPAAAAAPSAADLQLTPEGRCDWDRRTAAEVSAHEFHEKYSRRPVAVSGLAAGWLLSGWVGDASAVGEAASHLRDELRRARRSRHERWADLRESPQSFEMRSQLRASYSAPPLVAVGDVLARKCDASLPRSWMLFSPEASGPTWHVAPFNSSSWEALLGGRKRWLLYPPHAAPPGIAGQERMRASGGGMFRYFDPALNLDGWWGATQPWDTVAPEPADFIRTVLPGADEGRRPLECTLLPGETLFVPGGWWQMSVATAPSTAVRELYAARDDAGVGAELAKRPKDTLPWTCGQHFARAEAKSEL